MIKGKWQAIVFILLILLLAIGLSTVALNERVEEGDVTKTHKMAIALVNEDAGSAFNDAEVNFGDQFASQMNRDQTHDWYVVSRGVAESGFERNAYDMMIVIPNGFSDNALSIDEDAPDQVTLEYKINTTGHDDVRAEAEKAAGEILTNFNKQLIDVFFVSIIGNLQEAQDHVGEIIQKEKEYTDEYRANVFSPLDNFTGQFERVQQSADRSKDNYAQLDDVLRNFESNLLDKVETSEEYDENIAQVLLQKEESSTATSVFAEQFAELTGQMSNEDILQQMSQLQEVNAYLYNQLRARDNNDEINRERTLQTRINSLNGHLGRVKTNADDLTEYVLDDLSKGLEEIIKGGIEKSFDDSMEDIKISDLIDELDDTILEKINHYITEIPEDLTELNRIGITDETMNTMYNIASVTDRFTELDDFYEERKKDNSPSYTLVDDLLTELREELMDGIVVTDSITLGEYDANESFTLTVDQEYFDVGWVTINGKRFKSTEGPIQFDINEEDSRVDIAVRLSTDEDRIGHINLFKPLEWEWTLEQTTEETTEDDIEIDDPIPEDENEGEDDTSDDEDEMTNDETEENDEQDEQGVDDENQEEGSGEAVEEEEADQLPGETEGERVSEEIPSSPATTITQTSETTITNSQWNQKVHSSLYRVLYEDVEHANEQFTADLIEQSIAMMESIQALETLYELYFGLDLTMDNDELEELLANNNYKDEVLIEIASEDSLYYLIHQKEIKEMVKKRIRDDVADSIKKEMNQPLEDFQADVSELHERVLVAKERSSELAEVLEVASANAESLNTNVGELLTEVDEWRNNSNELIGEQMDVLNKDSEVEMALMQLDSGFKPLLSASESLASQAEANFESTEHVYETLDAIDEQADDIQQSGTTLVSQASELAVKFSEKASEDLDFADNFNEVLANSRIGDRQNEDLYSFLSNPVQTRNTGIIQETESFSPYFLIFIMAIVSFFTAYVLANNETKGTETTDFEKDQTFIQKNTRPMIMTGGLGLIEGLLIGTISFILLDISQSSTFSWIAFITVMMIGMVLLATYLLRQLKMVGMFILLVIFSLYLLLTKSLGFQFGNHEAIKVARKVSPLQQLENWVTSFIEGTMNTSTLMIAFIILIVAAIIGLALNLLIIGRTTKEEGMEDERTSEAN